MKRKLKTGVVLVSLFALMSSMGTGFASTPEYTVKDEKVIERLNKIEEILKVIEQKELSMDVLNKTQLQRQNDQMTKLSMGKLTPIFKPDGFMSTQKDNPLDISSIARGLGIPISIGGGLSGVKIPGLGSLGGIIGAQPDYQRIVLGSISDGLGKLGGKNGQQQREDYVLHSSEELVEKLKPLASPEIFNDCASVESLNITYANVLDELDRLEMGLYATRNVYRQESYNAIKVLDKNIGEISQADSNKQGSNGILGALIGGTNISLLSKSFEGVGGLGQNDTRKLFDNENSSSIVAKTEENTMLQTIDTAKRSIQLKNQVDDDVLRTGLSYIEITRGQAYDNYVEKKAELEEKAVASLKFDKVGTKHKCAGEELYGGSITEKLTLENIGSLILH